MDPRMPRRNGLTATWLIKAERPESKIVILTMSDREADLLAAIKNGAAGYPLKGLRTEEVIGQLNGLASGAATIAPALAAQVLAEFSREETAAADSRPAARQLPTPGRRDWERRMSAGKRGIGAEIDRSNAPLGGKVEMPPALADSRGTQ